MTAVQWFGEQTLNYLSDEQRYSLIEAFKQALELEKQQIKNAFVAGTNSEDYFYPSLGLTESEVYYNETYKKDIK